MSPSMRQHQVLRNLAERVKDGSLLILLFAWFALVLA